jgi:diguanylate cyclase (GGDEF)-like protein/PAS domain S-box-containing protein
VSEQAPRLDAGAIRNIHAVLSRIHQGQELTESLMDVARALVDVLGFNSACVNIVDGDDLEAVAVVGPDGYSALLGQRNPVSRWHQLMQAGQNWHGLSLVIDPRDMAPGLRYIEPGDDAGLLGKPGVWGALGMLLAPMKTADGELVGIVTVDGRPHSLWPDEFQCTLLEMFTVQAGMAIDKQRLTASLRLEHERLHASEKRFRLAFDGAPIGMSLLRVAPGSAQIVDGNESLASMFRLSTAELNQRSMLELVHPDDRPGCQEDIDRLLSKGLVQTEKRYVRSDGSVFWGLLHGALLSEESDGFGDALAQIVDVTDAKEAERALTHLASHDPLTGLANRTLLRRRIDEVVSQARRSGRTGAVLFVDLDHFKEVNDLHGHLVGDEVLAMVARRVQAAVRTTDTVGRIGGDEFVVVTYPVSLSEAEQMAVRIARLLGERIHVGDVSAQVEASIGLVLVTGAVEPLEVLRRADAAMYRVKEQATFSRYAVDTA